MLTLSVTVFACTDTGEVGEETKEPIEKVEYTEGVHDFTAPDIEGEWLIKEGVTDYQMLVPATSLNIKSFFVIVSNSNKCNKPLSPHYKV